LDKAEMAAVDLTVFDFFFLELRLGIMEAIEGGGVAGCSGILGRRTWMQPLL
jgi:hypothetical protein